MSLEKKKIIFISKEKYGFKKERKFLKKVKLIYNPWYFTSHQQKQIFNE